MQIQRSAGYAHFSEKAKIMIPRHTPPYHVGIVLLSMPGYPKKLSIEQLEEAYAQVYGVPYAVLLPSARAGICWSLKASSCNDRRVLCPAYTCKVVHEAIARSGGKLFFVDTAEGDFLMDETALLSESTKDYAIVFCEIYGYAYNLSDLVHKFKVKPRVSIIDMAMTVPHSKLFERLQGNDFGVISFGIGKCMYAGWGGMGFTHDNALASEIRKLRDSMLTRSTMLLCIKRSLEIFTRVLAHEPMLYRFSRKIKEGGLLKKSESKYSDDTPPSYYEKDKSLSHEWFLPSTSLDRTLAFYNLKNTERYSKHRIFLAERYHKNFEGVNGIVRPKISPYPLSHYTIRVKTAIRQALRQQLWASGIDTGTFFPFPNYLSDTIYSNTSKISSEVINLPLNIDLNAEGVDRISNATIHYVLRLNR